MTDNDEYMDLTGASVALPAHIGDVGPDEAGRPRSDYRQPVVKPEDIVRNAIDAYNPTYPLEPPVKVDPTRERLIGWLRALEMIDPETGTTVDAVARTVRKMLDE